MLDQTNVATGPAILPSGGLLTLSDERPGSVGAGQDPDGRGLPGLALDHLDRAIAIDWNDENAVQRRIECLAYPFWFDEVSITSKSWTWCLRNARLAA